MPTAYGFTGQLTDSASGLDYYGARYYDPLAGQFTSGDSVVPGGGFDLWGLSRYAYVGGNPIARTDPTGHRIACEDDPSCGGCVINCGGGGDNGGSGDNGNGDNNNGNGNGNGTNGNGNDGNKNNGNDNNGNGTNRNDNLASKDGCLQQFYGLCTPPVSPNHNVDAQSCLGYAGYFTACLAAMLDNAERFDDALNSPLGRLFHENGGGDSSADTAEQSAAQDAEAASVQAGQLKGNAWRDELADLFRQQGYDVRTEVYKKTIFGKRFIDIEVARDGEVLGGIEAKVGQSRYRATQRAKDAWLWVTQGYRVNVVRDS
jgi:RHS repeat-associated protein